MIRLPLPAKFYCAGNSFTAIVRQRQKPPSTHRGVLSLLKCI